MIREEAQVTAIIPWWPRRGWFPLVLQLLVHLPVLLPEVDGLLVGGDGVFHPNLHELCLAAWRLSGDLSAGEAFRERLQQPFGQLIDHRRAICTMPSGGPFLAGVLEGVRIPFTHLSGQFCPTYSKDLKHNTNRSHIFALSSCTNKVDGVPVGKHPLVARWILGDRSLHPPQHSLVPPWDPSVILVSLTEKL